MNSKISNLIVVILTALLFICALIRITTAACNFDLDTCNLWKESTFIIWAMWFSSLCINYYVEHKK